MERLNCGERAPAGASLILLRNYSKEGYVSYGTFKLKNSKIRRVRRVRQESILRKSLLGSNRVLLSLLSLLSYYILNFKTGEKRLEFKLKSEMFKHLGDLEFHRKWRYQNIALNNGVQ